MLDHLRVELSRELDNVLNIPETMALFIGSNPELAKNSFVQVAQRLLAQHEEIISILLAPDTIVQRVYPHEGNEAVLGLRFLEEPEQAEAVQRAIDTGRTVVAGPLHLKQGGFGIASRTPIYVFVSLNTSGEDRYWGLVSLTLDAHWLLGRIGFLKSCPEFDLAVRGTDGKGNKGTIFGGNPSVFERAPAILEYVLPGGGIWEFAATPVDGWPGFHSGTSLLLGMAYALALCIGYLIYCLVNRHQTAVALASHDSLTGLFNRTVLLKEIEKMVLAAEAEKPCGVLIILDLDQFKPVNDRYGHRAGDKVLQTLADRLSEIVASDGIVVRLGGDEFALLLHKAMEQEAINELCKRILEALKQDIPLNDTISVSVGSSIGATLIRPADTDTTALIERADAALYASKNAGRGRFTIADE